MSAPPVPDIAAGNAAFSTAMRAFHAWEAGELQDALNAYEATRLLSTSTTSVTSNTIGTGDKTFTVGAGLGFVAGQSINVANTANPANYMSGIVKSYASTTLVVTVITTGGAGTLSAWSIALGLSGGGASLGTNTFTGVQNFAQGTDIASAATINLTTATGNIVTVTGTVATSAVTLGAGMTRIVRAAAAWPLTYNATTNNITGGVSTTLSAGDFVFYQNLSGVVYGIIIKTSGQALVASKSSPTRQTVLFGAVDTAGLPAFGGSTGSTTVTQSTTLTVTAANGFDANGNVDRVGQITNASWTGLSTNGTMYLYLDIASNGTCTTGSGTLAPTYREGGADVVTANQFTFNIQEMIGKVGNGATAAQTYRVYVGEVTVAGGVVTAIRWYALRGRYRSAYTATLPNTATVVTQNSNLGVEPEFVQVILRCTTTDNGFAVGNTIRFTTGGGYNGTYIATGVGGDASTVWLSCGGASGFVSVPKGGGTSVALTPANWSYALESKRIWGGAA